MERTMFVVGCSLVAKFVCVLQLRATVSKQYNRDRKYMGVVVIVRLPQHNQPVSDDSRCEKNV